MLQSPQTDHRACYGGGRMGPDSWFEREGVIESVRGLLAERSFEGYLVGGFVRDLLTGRDTRDLDVAVAGDAVAVARELADRLGGAFVLLDEERRTARVVLRDREGRFYVDFATLRDGSLEKDLAARDFTINAMAIDVAEVGTDRAVVDLFGGRKDLEDGTVRAVSDSVFQDDAIRLLRGIRIAAELEMEVEEGTEALMRRDAHLVTAVSAERVRDELCKILAVAGAEEHLRYMDRLGLLAHLVPELEPLRGLEQPPPHYQDVFGHSLAAVEGLDRVVGAMRRLAHGEELSIAEGWGVEAGTQDVLRAELGPFSKRLLVHLGEELVEERSRSVLLKLAALLHDLGKASTGKVDEEGRIRFFGHAREGSALAARCLRRLRFGGREVRLVRTVIRNHMRPLHLAKEERVSRRAIHRFFRDSQGAGVDVLLLALGDNLALVHHGANVEQWKGICEVAGVLLRAYYEQHDEVIEPRPLLRGSDLLERLGMEPGPSVGRILRALSEAQAAGQVTTTEEALELAESLLYEEGE
jgi:putative nucleotidyltransferase with HDIG domain